MEADVIRFQELMCPCIEGYYAPLLYSLSIHLLLNMVHVPGTILGMADATMNETASLPRGVQHLAREWALEVNDVTVGEQRRHGEHGHTELRRWSLLEWVREGLFHRDRS